MTTTTVDLDQAPPARLDIPVIRAIRPGIEVRQTDGSAGELTGHFSVFNRWFEINSWFEGHFLERTQPGSFSRTFNAWRDSNDPHRIQVMLEHGFDPTVGDKPLGIASELSEDDTGAFYRADLFDASYVRDLIPALEAGVYGASYRFRVIQDSWNNEPGESEHNPDGIPERTITEQRVFEFGPTVFPANPYATAGMRSLTDLYYERSYSEDQFSVLTEHVRSIRTPGASTGLASTPDNPLRSTYPAELLNIINEWKGQGQ